MPGPKSSGHVRVNVLLHPTIKRRVEASARRQGKSFSQWMREAAIDKLNESANLARAKKGQ